MNFFHPLDGGWLVKVDQFENAVVAKEIIGLVDQSFGVFHFLTGIIVSGTGNSLTA